MLQLCSRRDPGELPSVNSYLYGEMRRSSSIISIFTFVFRGLQGSYNALSTKHNFTVPHGDVLLFSFATAQIMYAWMMRPDTLPHSYNAWVSQAAKVPVPVIAMNKGLVREGIFNIASIDAIFKKVAVSHTLQQTAIFSNGFSVHHPVKHDRSPNSESPGITSRPRLRPPLRSLFSYTP